MFTNIRKERPVGVAEFCQTSAAVEKKIENKIWGTTSIWQKNDPRAFNLFYMIEDNYYGNTDLCVVIPVNHVNDYGGTMNLEHFHKKSRNKKLIVSKGSLSRYDQPIYDFFIYKNAPRVTNMFIWLNGVHDFTGTKLEFKVE